MRAYPSDFENFHDSFQLREDDDVKCCQFTWFSFPALPMRVKKNLPSLSSFHCKRIRISQDGNFIQNPFEEEEIEISIQVFHFFNVFKRMLNRWMGKWIKRCIVGVQRYLNESLPWIAWKRENRRMKPKLWGSKLQFGLIYSSQLSKCHRFARLLRFIWSLRLFSFGHYVVRYFKIIFIRFSFDFLYYSYSSLPSSIIYQSVLRSIGCFIIVINILNWTKVGEGWWYGGWGCGGCKREV